MYLRIFVAYKSLPIYCLLPSKFLATLIPFVRVYVQYQQDTEKHLAFVESILQENELSHYMQISNQVLLVSVIDKEPILTKELFQLAQTLSNFYLHPFVKVLFFILPKAKKEHPLSKHLFLSSSKTEEPKILTEEQKTTLKDILECKEKLQTHLIYGVTGSGKTEIYIEIIKKYISQKCSVLFLVPEIALSYQLFQRLDPIFGDQITLIHSGYSKGVRLTEHTKTLQSEYKIIIGTRSTIFSPVSNLRLIIIDEEHDTSYKEQHDFFYNAKDVAYMRLRHLEGLKPLKKDDLPRRLIFGSATPSMEVYVRAKNKQIQLHQLIHRATKVVPPHILFTGVGSDENKIFSELLISKIKEHLSNKKQVLLLLNRRGYAKYLYCNQCKINLECSRCSVSLTYHQKESFSLYHYEHKEHVKCHLCGHQEPYSSRNGCKKCGRELELLNYGTQQAEDHIEQLFENIPFARLDRDSSQRKEDQEEIIKDILSQKIRIVLGTQMIAKGFDFPNVTLVGILDADIGFSSPDFRANERVFQVLLQMCGRAGRHTQGEVVIQTRKFEHPVLQNLKTANYDTFMQDEINIRKHTGFPPFNRLLRILIYSKEEIQLKKIVIRINQWIEQKSTIGDLFNKTPNFQDLSIWGPIEAPIYKKNNNYRIHYLIKHSDHAKLLEFAKKFATSFKEQKKSYKNVYYSLDFNPLDLT